jgi:hypothetical protein
MQDLYFIGGQIGWAWQSYLSSLEESVDGLEGPEGYLTALAACYKVYKAEFPLPEVLFPCDRAPETANNPMVDRRPPRNRQRRPRVTQP